MRISRQTRYNILAEKLQNASKIKKLLNEFEESYKTSDIEKMILEGKLKEINSIHNEAINRLNIIRTSFKEYSPIEKQDNDTLWSKYIEFYKFIQNLKEVYKEENRKIYEKNINKINQEILSLENKYLSKEASDFKNFWNDYSHILELFKNTEEIKFRERENLWKKLSDIKNEVKKIKKENHKKWILNAKEQIEDFDKNIKHKTEKIENLFLQIEKCKSMISENNSSKNRENIEQWISEKEELINKFKFDIVKFEKRQKSLKNKIGI